MSRILVVVASPDRSGAPAVMLQNLRSLRAADHDVHVVHGVARYIPVAGGDGAGTHATPAGGTGDIVADLREIGCTTTALGTFRWRTGVVRAVQVCLLARRRRPDLIIGAMAADRTIVVLAARFVRRPSVVVLQSAVLFGARSGLRSRIYAWTLRSASRLVAVGDHVAHQAVEVFGASPDRVVTIPNGIELDEWTRRCTAARRAGGRVTDDAVTFVCVARLSPTKRQRNLVAALATLPVDGPAWRLLVVGDSPVHDRGYRDALEADIAKLGLTDHVDLVGWRTDVAELLVGCDVYVHATALEGFPIALVEAMAAGLPVIVSDAFDRPVGFVEDVHGRRVAADDVDALADALRSMLALSAAERVAMGQRCAQIALRYDINRANDQFRGVVDEVIGGGGR